jgi:hypothetical protein
VQLALSTSIHFRPISAKAEGGDSPLPFHLPSVAIRAEKLVRTVKNLLRVVGECSIAPVECWIVDDIPIAVEA